MKPTSLRILQAVIPVLVALPALAQVSPSIVCNQDNYNGTRYVGGRNSARTPAGDLLVVFEPGELYTSQDIYWSAYDAAGGTWSAPAALSSAGYIHTGTPGLAADDTGSIYAYWKEKNGDGDRDAMFAHWSGGSWGAPVLADDIANNAGVGTIEIASDGTLFNMWSTWGTGSTYDANIYSGKSTDNGLTWNTTNLTSTYPTPDALPLSFLDVALAPGSDGVMYAAWEDDPEGGSWECLLAVYDGASWATPEIVSETGDSLGVLKYVDGCTPAPGAVVVHEMGPDGYTLADSPSEIYYDSGTYRVLGSYYNIKYISPSWNRDELVADVVDYFAPGSILVVDDDNRYNHETYLYESLDNGAIAYDLLDTDPEGDDVALSPDAATLLAYDLVIWFCGDDGGNDAFWEADSVYETDNPDVAAYLDGGGDLWLIGLDVLYDRYGGGGGPEDDFVAGDFCYDYLGLDSYDVQAWIDDGNEGVSQLDLVGGQTITDVDPIFWGVGGVRQGEPTIAVDPDGLLQMVFVQSGGIYHRSRDGEVWNPSVQLDESGDASTVRPSLAADANGGLYATWKQETGQDPTIWNVFYSTSTDAGVTWTTPVQLSQATEVSFSGYSVMRPTVGARVRPPIPDVFEGGADVIWTQWNSGSDLGFDVMYGRIPYLWLPPVENLTIEMSAGDALLDWDTVEGATGYRVYSLDEGYQEEGILVAELDGATTSWTDVGAVAAERRFYRVTAIR